MNTLRAFLVRRSTTLSLAAVGFGVAILALTRGRAGDYGGMVELFWVGVLTAAIAIWLAVWMSDSRAWTTLLIGGFGLGLYCLKLFRSPFEFVYHDELGHFRALRDLVSGPGLFQPNPLIPIVRDYPGLHAAAGADALAAGLAPFVAAVILIGFVHIATPLLVMVLSDEITGSVRAGGMAALIYMTNPSFVYFDSQFAYESLGLPLLLAVLVCYVRWRRDKSTMQMLLAGIFASALTITHHLTAFELVGILALFTVADLMRRDRVTLAGSLMLTGYALGLGVAWIVFEAPQTVAYLSPYVALAIASSQDFIARLAAGEAPTKQLFEASVIPAYERGAAIASAAASVVLALLGAIHAARSGRTELRVLAVLGLAYVASAPLIFTGSSEGAKRLWAVAFIGVAVTAGSYLAHRPRTVRRPWARLGRSWARFGVAGAAAVLVMGGAVVRTGEHLRFPGPYQIASDARSLTTDTVDAAAWLEETARPGARLFADRTGSLATGGMFDLFPDTHSFDGSKPWRVFYAPAIDRNVAWQLAEYRIDYIFVDRRMAQFPPRIGFYFEHGELLDTAYPRVIPLSDNVLDKFVSDPRFARVYDGGSIVIYAVDRSISSQAEVFP